MPIETWFSTVVFFEDAALPDEVHEAAMEAVWDVVGRDQVDRPIRYTAFNMPNTLHLDPRLEGLFAVLYPAIRRFLFDELRFDSTSTEYFVGRCWPVVQTVGGEGGAHHHGGAVASGVFYLEAPPGSGGLELQAPAGTSFDQVLKQELTPLTYDTAVYPPIRHRLMMFGSHLRHRALANDPGTEAPRIAIAFDVYSQSDIRVPFGPPHPRNLKPIP